MIKMIMINFGHATAWPFLSLPVKRAGFQGIEGKGLNLQIVETGNYG